MDVTTQNPKNPKPQNPVPQIFGHAGNLDYNLTYIMNLIKFEVAVGLAAIASATTSMVELTSIEEMHKKFNEHDFSVLSMYTSHDLDLEVDTYMEAARRTF